jgi:type IV secretion system protein TrbI
MVQSLKLAPADDRETEGSIRRVNRLPVLISVTFLLIFVVIVVIGLSWRGLSFVHSDNPEDASGSPATNFADQLKRGVANGIIGDPESNQVYLPAPRPVREVRQPAVAANPEAKPLPHAPKVAPVDEWESRLQREQNEQIAREKNRQEMARLQAGSTALDSPIKVDVSGLQLSREEKGREASARSAEGTTSASDLYAAAIKSGLAGQNNDPNGQASKDRFFNQDIKDLGYLSNRVVPQIARYELKRGSVIPATLITAINSDLPGRIIAQVSHNVYDSATGYQLLIPQGARLFGRYDSKIAFGQGRVLIIWTDLIFPNGSTLSISGMPGTDSEGAGGFKDKVDRHLLRTFGSAALVALIGTGVDLAMPARSSSSDQEDATDAVRRNFADTFGRMADNTITKGLNVQPTLRIRAGYRFNVLVDQDIIFPASYSQD